MLISTGPTIIFKTRYGAASFSVCETNLKLNPFDSKMISNIVNVLTLDWVYCACLRFGPIENSSQLNVDWILSYEISLFSNRNEILVYEQLYGNLRSLIFVQQLLSFGFIPFHYLGLGGH